MVMEYEDVIALGWKDQKQNGRSKTKCTFIFKSEGFDYHIMSVMFGLGTDNSRSLVMIKCVPEKTLCNIWENSETHFYGEIKLKEELDLVMQLLGIIEYK